MTMLGKARLQQSGTLAGDLTGEFDPYYVQVISFNMAWNFKPLKQPAALNYGRVIFSRINLFPGPTRKTTCSSPASMTSPAIWRIEPQLQS